MKKTNLKYIGKLISPYIKIICFILICLIISALLNLTIPLLSKELMDHGFIPGNKKKIVAISVILMLIHWFGTSLDLMKERNRIRIAAKLRLELFQRAFRHLLKIKIGYYHRTNYGELLSNIETDVGNICNVMDNTMFFAITQIFNMIGGLIGLFIINVPLTLLVLLFLPVKYFTVDYLAKKRKKSMNEFIIKQGEFSKWFGNTISGIKEIRLFHIQDVKSLEFEKKQKDVISCKNRIEWLMQMNNTVDTTLISILMTLIYILAADMLLDLNLSIGSVFSFVSYSTFVMNPISALLSVQYYLAGIVPSLDRYREFMEWEEEGNGSRSDIQNGDIIFDGVTFSYIHSQTSLCNVSFQIPKRSKVAMIGKNGAGKSTILHLLLRFYEPQEGSIRINGNGIQEMELSEYRRMFAVVSQQIYLFDDTIYNNICLNKEVGKEEYMQAVHHSGLSELIKEKGNGYRVGENGNLLSGGQKQKVALARALVSNAPILIFDEATSNIDIKMEEQLRYLLKTRLREKTVIVITHKMEILKDMDGIILMEQGNAKMVTYENLLFNHTFMQEMQKDETGVIAL